MGKGKKQVKHTRKEEQQAKKVMRILTIAALIIALAMLVGVSVWS